MTKPDSKAAAFSLEGKLAKIHRQKNKIQHIKLVTDRDKYWIKISKKLRQEVADLSCGCQLQVTGKSKQGQKKGKIKYKAQKIVLISQATEETPAIKTKTVSLLPIFDTKTKAKAKVLICQKSNCWKKGGQKVYETLTTVLKNRNLSDQIAIKKTGCLKKCKKAPNLVMLPDKAHYTKVKPKQVESFVAKHLIAETQANNLQSG